MGRKRIPFLPLHDDPRVREQGQVHAVVPVEMGEDDEVDVAGAEPVVGQQPVEGTDVDHVGEFLTGVA